MKERKFAFATTIPVLLGYLAIGFAFGLIVKNVGYGWYIVLLMSVVIYAGAGQYAAAGMFAAGAGYMEIAVATFLINSRHMVYGLSLLNKFENTRPYSLYLIFGLTDETFGVLTTTTVPPELDRAKTYFYITLFDQLYWIFGGVIGYFAGTFIPFDFAGVDFALTALFTVLLIEQWRNCRSKLPFALAALSALAALFIVGPQHMLIVSFLIALGLLLLFRRKVATC